VALEVAQSLAVRVHFPVEFASRLRLSSSVRARLERILRDLSDWLSVLPADSGYLKAIDGQAAELNLEGWRIEFRVDRAPPRIIVTGAHRQSEAA